MECQLCKLSFDVMPQAYHPTKIFVVGQDIFWMKNQMKAIEVKDAHVCPACFGVIEGAIEQCVNSKIEKPLTKGKGFQTTSGFAVESPLDEKLEAPEEKRKK